MDYRNTCQAKNILLTGASGVLGGRLAAELLKSTTAIIYCISRCTDIETAKEKILNVIKVYDPKGELVDECWRLVPILGNMVEEHFSFAETDYNEFAQSIDLVFHCAANVSLMASYEKLKPTNVDGTQRIVDFCLKAHAPLLFVSSYSVIGDQLYHECTLQEDQLDIGQHFEELGYEQSKFEAELLIHNASDKGLHWAIVRPGNIWGDSETGAYPLLETRVKGIYYEMIKSLIETGYTYSSDEDFDVTPVDYVAKASLYIALNIHQTVHKTYHLTNPNQLTFNQLVNCIRDNGYTIRNIADEEYFSALYEDRMLLEDKPYRSTFTDLLSIFVDEDLIELGKWDTKEAVALLEKAGIQCPIADKNLFSTYLKYAAKRNWISDVEEQKLAKIIKEMENKIFMQHLYDEDFSASAISAGN
ncbi:thioester reductase domain-containing protein [Paraglaciecola sp.]|uniref:thioester reductase domain-containing protein n=1 Tax=Paraglaciecola sp. TaxID=1920173 RepID=UPI0030F38810